MKKQSIHLFEQGETMTVEQMKQSFDSFINQIDENNNLLCDVKFIKEMVEIAVQSNEKHLCDPTIINHRIFVIFRDYYLTLLQRWRDETKLDEISCFIFETISNFFLKMSSHISDVSLSKLKELIFDEILVNEINQFLEDLSLNKKYFEDPQIKGIDNFFRLIQRLERTHTDDTNNKLFDNIVKCICSSSFIEIFLHSVNQETDNPGEKFLLNTCTDYIYSHSLDKQHKQSLIDIRQSLLHPFTEWLISQSSNFRLWNNRIILIFRQISFLLTLSIEFNPSIILDNDIFNSYSQLIDSFINILYSIIESDNKLTQLLIGTLIPNLYTMTLSNQLEKYIQNKHITSLIFKLMNVDNDEIQLNALKILSSITIEQDTKNNHYSNNIAKIFIDFIKKTIDDSNQTLRFYYFLRSFKNLIQFDQIKIEFLKQNGLPLIVRCITDKKFKSLQVQEPALEIVLSLTFNKEGYQQIKQNSDQLKSLLSSSNQGISHTVNYILWKLEKEETKPIIDERIYKYDFILSYSHSDKDLCLRISDQLIKDGFRISIDQDETFPKTINEKCEIIDSSEYFLICLSDSYKQNLYCQCEAFYAFERQYQIIPLIVTSNYRLDGWLNRIISGKICIDFSKLDFEVAQMKLKTEIDRQRKYSKILSIPIELPKTKNEYPSQLDQWTNEDVKLFLITNNLHSFLPIFSEMNGNLLHELYRMCLANRESMFHTLKTELLTLNSSNQSLTLIIYLRFLTELQKYIPSFVINPK